MLTFLKTMAIRRDGSSAVEFALLAPVFICAMMAMVGYGIYLSAASGVQQLSEDAVRAAVAGLSVEERKRLAAQVVAAGSRHRAFISPEKLSVDVSMSPYDPNQFSVVVSLDVSHLPIWSAMSFAMPSGKVISRTTVMRVGGV